MVFGYLGSTKGFSEETGLKVDKDLAREIVYGMPHSVWKDKYQTDADENQKNKFKNSMPKDH